VSALTLCRRKARTAVASPSGRSVRLRKAPLRFARRWCSGAYHTAFWFADEPLLWASISVALLLPLWARISGTLSKSTIGTPMPARGIRTHSTALKLRDRTVGQRVRSVASQGPGDRGRACISLRVRMISLRVRMITFKGTNDRFKGTHDDFQVTNDQFKVTNDL
jgi:hypothetical protein